ncbi:hypothetical protein SAMN05192553_1038 [Cyclobacterium xiamenense]|uniref:Uncharacterized protein n=1 Tax=Cyclobacterium xiamenense TaxID=1297121 RepID=A0A1H6XKS1_9BACT|nr:hypothetical protein SAMN05192553_1038 [Cyclobacterium xiamenense]
MARSHPNEFGNILKETINPLCQIRENRVFSIDCTLWLTIENVQLVVD